MKSCLIAIAVISALTPVAYARPRPHGFGGKHFEANKRFGLGVELGEPTALTGKYYLSDGGDRALDFGIGDIYDYYSYGGFTAYMDYLWHPAVLAETEPFELPFYIGIGGRFWSWDDVRAPGPSYPSGDAFGARVPIGLLFDFNNVPLDLFVQIVPTIDFFFAKPAIEDRDVYLIVDASVGIRYYFN